MGLSGKLVKTLHGPVLPSYPKTGIGVHKIGIIFIREEEETKLSELPWCNLTDHHVKLTQIGLQVMSIIMEIP